MAALPEQTEHNVEATDFLASLEKSLPALFDRETASKSLGGTLSPKTLSNSDAHGNGPRIKMKLGKKIVYELTAFLEWLGSRLR